MTLIDQALAELKLTTVGYINKKWTTPPNGSRWANALALLAQANLPSRSLSVDFGTQLVGAKATCRIEKSA